jgi:structural maintenance of chromosome 2
MLGGKTKYTINGRTVNQADVQNFFHSVQLNVNNPHFLIMQGRITKVLNMKPPEILSMIEEASGTRMYETKKEASLKILAKKQTKIDEIDQCMREEIAPALDKLHDERASYATWQANQIELDRLERFVVACQYKEAQEKIERCEDDKRALESNIQSKEDQKSRKEEDADRIAKQIKDLENQRAAETEGELQALKKEEAEVSKQLVKYTTLASNQKDNLSTERENLTAATSQLEALTKSIDKKEVELAESNELVRQKESESNEAEAAAIKAREMYQNAFAGIATEENTSVLSIPEQVATWEKKAREAQSMLQQGELHVAHTKEYLKELKATLKSQKASYDIASKEAAVLQAKVEDMNKRIAAVSQGFNPKTQKQLAERSATLKTSINQLRDNVDRLTASIEAKLKFDYADPERGFNRSRVKGLVARLVRVNDHRAATALEIAAGAKLYQVVVDTEQTGKLLLQKGQLKRRVTILPLNKLSSRCTDPARVTAAKSIASSMHGSAFLALELVGYEAEVQRAMEHTFGSTIICDTSDVAKTIAFDRNVRNRTVTFDGDTYDPSGTLTGGSKNSLGKLLVQIDELSQASQELSSQEAELSSVSKQLAAFDENDASIRDLRSQLELSEQAYKLCQAKLNSSSYAMTQQEIDGLEAKLLTYQSDADAHKQAHRKANEELHALQNMEKNAKKSREATLKEMETTMKNRLKSSNQLKANLTSIKSRRDIVEAELEAFIQEKAMLTEQITALEISSNRAADEHENLAKQLAKLTEKYEVAKKSLADKQKELNENSKEIKALSNQREAMLEEAKELGLEVRKLKHKVDQWGKDYAAAEKTMRNLTKEYAWIEKEKQFFGVVGSDYDFEARDVNASHHRYKQLKTDQVDDVN